MSANAWAAWGSLSLCVLGLCGVGLWASQSAVGPRVRACYGAVSVGGSKGLCGCSKSGKAAALHNKFQAAAVEVPCLVCLLSSSGLQLRGGDWLAWCC